MNTCIEVKDFGGFPKKKRGSCTWQKPRKMAEWVGFEPTDGCPSTDFECFDLIRSYCTLEENMRTYRKLKEC